MVFHATLRLFSVVDPEAQIVPKFAATLASLLLIASSIGVNIARYPQVGRTVDAGQRTDAPETTSPAPAAQQASPVETIHPDSLPARETEIEPAKSPQVAEVAPAEKPRVEEPLDPKPPAGAARPQPAPAATILDVRPMVPVAGLGTVAGTADPPAGYDDLQRLPPVEPTVSAVTELQALGPDEAQPYTATSTP